MCTKQFLGSSLLLLLAAAPALAQAPTDSTPQAAGAGPATRVWQGPGEGRGQPLIGKITAINSGSLELTKPDGSTATLKITGKTEFRKDRQSAKLGDFKVGDTVFIRAEDSGGQGVTALMIAGRTGGGPSDHFMTGVAGPGGGMVGGGELGKDYIFGEVKSVDAPKITVLRPDKVTQTLELNEDTSLRKGRDSVTMADIQRGDHLFAHGAVQNNVFVPKNVMVIPAEQWRRMQEMGMTPGANKPADAPKPNPQQP